MFFLLHRINDTIDNLNEVEYFSRIDLKSGYWQIPLREADKKLTVFNTYYNHFEFNLMSFGLCNEPAMFHREMNSIIKQFGYKFTMVYLDDLIIYSKDIETHMKHVITVLQEICSYNLTKNYGKSEFFRKEINYLGYRISKNNIKISEDNIEAIARIPTPKAKLSIQQFLGLCSYFRKFIKNFALISKPLNSLLRKNTDFKWSAECQTCFVKLKEILCRDPILALPNFNCSFILTVDACKEGLGVILTQIVD